MDSNQTARSIHSMKRDNWESSCIKAFNSIGWFQLFLTTTFFVISFNSIRPDTTHKNIILQKTINNQRGRPKYLVHFTKLSESWSFSLYMGLDSSKIPLEMHSWTWDKQIKLWKSKQKTYEIFCSISEMCVSTLLHRFYFMWILNGPARNCPGGKSAVFVCVFFVLFLFCIQKGIFHEKYLFGFPV